MKCPDMSITDMNRRTDPSLCGNDCVICKKNHDGFTIPSRARRSYQRRRLFCTPPGTKLCSQHSVITADSQQCCPNPRKTSRLFQLHKLDLQNGMSRLKAPRLLHGVYLWKKKNSNCQREKLFALYLYMYAKCTRMAKRQMMEGEKQIS